MLVFFSYKGRKIMQEEEEKKSFSLLLNYLKFYFLKEDQLLIPGIIKKIKQNRNCP
jgi:hypothetical protein